MSEDCSTVSTCQADGGFVEDPADPCHELASCRIKDGSRGCHCNDGYRGDGVKTCDGACANTTELVLVETLFC